MPSSSVRSTFDPIVGVDAVTPGWLTEVLRASGHLGAATVVAVNRSACGTGQLADSFRFTVSYDREGAGPATLVGKFPSADPLSRRFGADMGFYKAEVRFYEELAPTLSVTVPGLVHAALAANHADFVLLFEDLAPARSVDQLVGCTADEAALAVEQAGAIHGGSWRRRDLADVAWLRAIVDAYVEATETFPQLIESFRELFGDVVPERDIAEAANLTAYVEPWKRILTEPRCLWHQDYRVDNMLFDAKDGVIPLAILDWQTLGMGCGVIDLAYFLGGSLAAETRRAHERDLVRHYHQALVAHGVSDYSAEACWEEYRLLSIFGLQTGIFGAVKVKRTPRGDEMWRLWVERHAAQVRDHDSFALLAARAGV
jgi:Ecdysteroid kinase-like family